MPRSDWWAFPRSTLSPLEGQSSEEQFDAIRWGKKVSGLRAVTVPGMTKREEVIELGCLRVLYLAPDGTDQAYPWRVTRGTRLAVGQRTNRLWIIPPPRGLDLSALEHMPARGWAIARTDYTAVKGDEDAYWYHEHEAPYPRLRRVDGGVQFSRGQYVIAPEGIVG